MMYLAIESVFYMLGYLLKLYSLHFIDVCTIICLPFIFGYLGCIDEVSSCHY